MALRRPPTRIELKADDVEEYDKVSNGQQWFIILLAFHKATYMLCIPYFAFACLQILPHDSFCVTQYFSLIFICYTSRSYTRPKIMKERRQAAEEQAAREKIPQQSKPGSDFLDSTTQSTSSSFMSSQKKKKPSAADRIGYKKNPR